MELKGKIVPEYMKVRKYFKRKRTERQTLEQLPKKLESIEKVLNDFNSHYNSDNISKRNNWMKHIDEKEKTYDDEIKLLSETLNKVNHTVVDIQIDNKRS